MGPCTYISRCRIECQIFFSELSPDFFPPSVPSSLLSFPRHWIGLHLSLYVFESEEGDDNKCETDTKGGGGREATEVWVQNTKNITCSALHLRMAKVT